MAITLKEIARKSIDFDPKQWPQVEGFLRSLPSYTELAYRMVLRGTFMRARAARHSQKRIDELYAQHVKTTADVEKLIRYCDHIQHKLGIKRPTLGQLRMQDEGR